MKINWSSVAEMAIAVLLALTVFEFAKVLFIDDATAKIAEKKSA